MTTKTGRSGFTLVEMSVVMVIFLVAAGLVYQVAHSLAVSYRTGETKVQVEENLRAGMAAVLRELRLARRETLVIRRRDGAPSPGGDSITFQVPHDRDDSGTVLHQINGQVEYSTPITFRLEVDGRLLREQDLDSSGLPEESVPGEVRTIARHAAGIEFFLTDAEEPGIQVTLTIERDLGQDVFRHTLRETAVPRN